MQHFKKLLYQINFLFEYLELLLFSIFQFGHLDIKFMLPMITHLPYICMHCTKI